MSRTHHTPAHAPGDPLGELLTDLADAAGSARGPLDGALVGRVTSRVRRRRAARRAGTTIAAAGAVGAVTFGASHVGGLGGARVTPGASGPDATRATAQPSTAFVGTAEPGAGTSPSDRPAPWAGVFDCGLPVRLGTPPEARGLTLEAAPASTVSVGVRDGQRVTAQVPRTVTYALVEHGVVVGYLWPDEDGTVRLEGASDTWVQLDEAVHLVACDADEPTGLVEAWPVVAADVSETTAGAPGQAVLVGEPRQVSVP